MRPFLQERNDHFHGDCAGVRGARQPAAQTSERLERAAAAELVGSRERVGLASTCIRSVHGRGQTAGRGFPSPQSAVRQSAVSVQCLLGCQDRASAPYIERFHERY